MLTRTLQPDDPDGFQELLTLALEGPDRTYLLIDGTCRRLALGVFDLDLDDIAPTLLLDPSGDGTITESGAFILDLGAILGRIGKDAFVRLFVAPWGPGHGVILRIKMPIARLRSHLSKFMHLTREDTKKKVFFRFWDARVALPYFAGISVNADRLVQWMHPRGGYCIEEIIFECDTPWPGLAMRAPPDLPRDQRAILDTLSLQEIEILTRSQIHRFDLTTAAALSGVLGPRAPACLSDSRFGPEFVQCARLDAQGFGITSSSGVARWAILSLALGLRFASTPAFSTATAQMLTSKTVSESEKLLTCADLAIQARNERQAAIAYALWHLDHTFAHTLADEIRCAFPHNALQEDSAQAVLDYFLDLQNPLRTLPLNHQCIAIALIGALGAWWPLDPLRRPLLAALCDTGGDDAILTNMILSLNDEDALSADMDEQT